jgi:hypothetical protein
MRCFGRIKSFKRCTRQCKFIFCKQHKLQWWTFIVVVGVIVGLYSDIFHLFSPNKQLEKSTEKILEEIKLSEENLSNEIQGIIGQSSFSSFEDQEKFEGFSIWMLTKLTEESKSGRKFIVDVGDVGKNRLSVYLDDKNDLCFRVIDDFSEVYTVKLPKKKYPYLDRFSLFTFEFGKSDRYSFVKIILNGQYQAKSVYDYKIEFSLSQEQRKSLTLGADLTGSNHGNFFLAELVAYSTTLNQEEKKGLVNYFTTKYVPKVKYYNGPNPVVAE